MKRKPQTLSVTLDTKELKLIQNYLTKGKPLNDPDNKEAMKVVMNVLQKIVDDSHIENLEIDVSNKLKELFGIDADIDPYGRNTGIALASNGLIELKDCTNPAFNAFGEYADMVQGGFWDEETGELTNGFISVEDANEILQEEDLGDIGATLKKEGNLVKIMLDI